MKIAVVQMSTLDYAEALKPCMHFNSIYCEKHGYTHICTTPPLPDLHAGFQKPYALLKQIHRFDYVMWVDIDASFVNPEIKLEDIINSDPDRDVWYADDPGDWILNSGVLIFKNSTKGIDLLWKWWENCNTTEKWGRDHAGDQMRLTTILYPDEGQEELDIFSDTLEEYKEHIEIINNLERFYGDETLGNLLRHSKALVEHGLRLRLLERRGAQVGASRVRGQDALDLCPQLVLVVHHQLLHLVHEVVVRLVDEALDELEPVLARPGRRRRRKRQRGAVYGAAAAATAARGR